MRIILVHKFFHVTGGAEVFLFEAARALKEHGHEVAFFSTKDERNQPSFYGKYFVDAPDFRSANPFKRAVSIGKILYSFEARQKFRKLLTDFKPDLVHAFAIFTHLSPSILDACREAGVPVVISFNDYKHICPNYKLFHHGKICEECKDGSYFHAVKNRCCQNSFAFSAASSIESYIHRALNILRKNVHTFLFASDFMLKKTSEFWGADSSRYGKLRNPFDAPAYPYGGDYGDYLIFFGRFVDEKGADILVRAMEKVPYAKLLMVGNGPEEDRLKSIANKLNLKNVKFVGPKWGRDLDVLLARSRFAVIPSVWHENFPYVILQSFALGKAVIGSDRGGIPELVQGKHGLIYPAESTAALAECIKTLWDDASRTVEMGRSAKEYVDAEFNYGKFYDDLMQIYRGVLR